MRKIFLVFVFVLALLVGVTFTAKNPQPVELTYYFGMNWQGPLSWLVILVLLTGMLMGVLICAVSNLKNRLLSRNNLAKSKNIVKK